MYFWSFLQIITSFFAICNAGTKEFLQDLRLNNSANWYPPYVPCANSRVIYPADIESLTLDMLNMEVREIILPNNGKIYINPGALKLTKELKNIDKCPVEDVRFINEEVEFWMDPKNWKEIGKNGQLGKWAKPHYDQLPCLYDTVYFPPGRDYRIQLPESEQKVSRIMFDNQSLSLTQWIMFLMESNQFFFDDEDSIYMINLYEKSCSFDDVCFCHKDETPTELCSIVKCELPKCLYSIQPINHCCRICGGILQMPFANNQIHRLFKRNVQKAIEEWGSDKIDWYISGVVERKNKYIQLVVVDIDEYNEQSTKLTEFIFKKLEENLKKNVKMQLAGLHWDGPGSPRGGLWETTVMFFIVMIFILSLMIYYYPPGFIRSFNPFRPGDFARFDNRSREGSLFLTTSHLSLDKAFENPMYNKMTASKEDKYEEVSINNGPDTEDEYVEPIGETSFQKLVS